jgi:2-amino-4-hydroxy-6-hydroxymethyldihydropteridine diphosphokinase
VRLLIGLGGNEGDVGAAFAAAAGALASRYSVLGRSRLYRTRPVGPDQPDFINAAVLLLTADHPMDVLELCQRLEAESGRNRTTEQRWGPRPLDLDLLIADNVVVERPSLTLPHPRLHLRRFALLPAAELAPDWAHPRLHSSLADLSAALDPEAQPCRAVGPFPDHPAPHER